MAILRLRLPSKSSIFSPFSDHRDRVVVRPSANYQPPSAMLKSVGVEAGICIKSATQSDDVIVRQCANYNPPMWNHQFIQSLHNQFTGRTYQRWFNQLKECVKTLLFVTAERRDSLEQLELIDALERLGISYHFENEIQYILEGIYNELYEEEADHNKKNNDLHATSLLFRLLRQHGFHISQDVFTGFKDETGNFKACLYEDTDGILSLYEASFLAMEGENILEEAKSFAMKYLKEYIKSSKDEEKVEIIRHSLKLPLHWRIPRLETKWYIDICERKATTINPILLQIAKLDFNMVQSIYQEDLKYTSSWWRKTELGEKLSFARDQLMENFFWTIGIGSQPQLQYFRRMGTKLVCLITMIDDIYDVYGTLDELELFTDAIERWDIAAMDQLPEYMKQCFLILYNSINEIISEALSSHGVDVMLYLRKVDEQNIGDVPKSIQCYMNETGASEKNAREYISDLVDELWKKLNEFEDEKVVSSKVFNKMSKDLARIAQCMYQYEDGHVTIDQNKTKERILSLLVIPITIH